MLIFHKKSFKFAEKSIFYPNVSTDINIDIDIFKNFLINIDINIDIFKIVLINIDIFKIVLFNIDSNIDIFQIGLIDIDINNNIDHTSYLSRAPRAVPVEKKSAMWRNFST